MLLRDCIFKIVYYYSSVTKKSTEKFLRSPVMDMDFSKQEERLRDEIRTWLRENIPKDRRPLEGADVCAYDLSWQRKQYEGGWAGINWPSEYGGRGLSLIQQLIWYEEYANADAPDVGICFVGLNHGGPTLIYRGDEEQKGFHLPRILNGESIWCQGFSEPGAGSDLASLGTRGRIEGDEIVVNGHKIWTSYAQYADYQELLIRTDPEASKHKGLTWLICDMRSSGITVRPIRMMTGEHDFCEVFYEDVRIPLRNVVGELHDGWSVAMSTLSFERGTAFLADQVRLARTVDLLIDLAKDTVGPEGRRRIDDDTIVQSLSVLRAQVAGLRAMAYAGVSRIARTGLPGPEGSMIRLYLAQILQSAHQVGMEILGSRMLDFGYGQQGWVFDYLYHFASSIGGGTSEIQREIIGERVLGLPRGR